MARRFTSPGGVYFPRSSLNPIWRRDNILKWTRVFLAVSFAALPALAARAHGGVPFGPYIFEYGWEEEPAVAGRANRINLTVSSSLPGGPPASLEGVTTEVHFEDEEIAIPFTPATTQLAGLFNAEFTPPGAGEYELHLSGQLD